jgi:hypothetical protein
MNSWTKNIIFSRFCVCKGQREDSLDNFQKENRREEFHACLKVYEYFDIKTKKSYTVLFSVLLQVVC